MNIKIKPNQNLNESENIIPEQNRQKGVEHISPKEKMFQTILNVKSKQVVLDCGAIMGKINIEFDDKMCLYWHFNNTTNFEGFIKSISNFLSASDSQLSKNDVLKLENEYNMQSKKS